MLPVLIHTNLLTVYTYGIFVALGFFWFLYIAWRNLRITKYKEEELFDQMLLSLLAGLIAGRMVYLLFHPEIIAERGFIAAVAIHLFPGFHGMTVLCAMGISLLVLLARGRKHTGAEILTYIAPAVFVFLAIVNIGGVVAGTDVGVVTTFPIRLKYAFYDGLRHVPGLYEGMAYFLFACIFQRLILLVRQEKAEHGLVVALMYWIISFVHIGASQLRDILTYQKVPLYRLFDLYFAIFTLLTALLFVMYHVRSYFFGMVHILTGFFNPHGKGIRTKTEGKTDP